MAQVALIEVSEPDADPFRRDELARRLRRELWERGVAADFVSLLPPPGGPGEAMASGALAVPLCSGSAAAALAEGVCRWLAAGEGRAVRVRAGTGSVELTRGAGECRRSLLEWLLRHGCGAEPEGAG
ncbi:hypothetical protein [Actinocorallia populi]|uniref:hypothetical protein n=1 Tax=Actinocorallia populi TaxID=2079200 RepID=UPI000D096FF4|nr:hypothetical protein [Actinocorallia populi]